MTLEQIDLMKEMMAGRYDYDSKRKQIIAEVLCERERQEELHPKGMNDPYTNLKSRYVAMTVITEEHGELAEAILEKDREGQRREAVHLIASALRFLEEVW